MKRKERIKKFDEYIQNRVQGTQFKFMKLRQKREQRKNNLVQNEKDSEINRQRHH
jgi:hypothetical protein